MSDRCRLYDGSGYVRCILDHGHLSPCTDGYGFMWNEAAPTKEEDAMEQIRELQKRVHKTAIEKGWWDEPTSLAEKLCLIHSEISEALEELRAGHAATFVYATPGWGSVVEVIPYDRMEHHKPPVKPEGFGIELADVIIRTLDLAEHAGIDMVDCLAKKMAYNETREYRHGGKKL